MAAVYTDPSQAPYWPKQHWRTSTPEAQGMDSAKLSGALEFASATSLPLHSVTVIRHGALVLDASFYPYGPGMLHNGASITKSVISALVGLAIHKGHIRSVAQPVLECFPDRTVPNLDAHKRAMTVEHLLTMTSGLDCGFTPTEAELFEMLRSQHWVEFALGLPMKLAPGTRFAYCSPGVHLLAGIIQATTGESPADLAHRYLFEPLGIQAVVWPADPQGVNFGFGGLRLHPHDMARLGYLYLHQGTWDGNQLLQPAWVAASTSPRVAVPPEPGLLCRNRSGWPGDCRPPREAPGRRADRRCTTDAPRSPLCARRHIARPPLSGRDRCADAAGEPGGARPSHLSGRGSGAAAGVTSSGAFPRHGPPHRREDLPT
jgi:CubicO group peptidase (beta-lactamase class C family)